MHMWVQVHVKATVVAAIETSGNSSSEPFACRNWDLWQLLWHCRAASLSYNQIGVAMIGCEPYSLWLLSVSYVWCQQQQWVRQSTRLMFSLAFQTSDFSFSMWRAQRLLALRSSVFWSPLRGCLKALSNNFTSCHWLPTLVPAAFTVLPKNL